MVDIAAVNAFILYNYIASMKGLKTVSENDFRDHLVLQIIELYGKHQREKAPMGRPPRSDERVKHGSFMFPFEERSRCHIATSKA